MQHHLPLFGTRLVGIRNGFYHSEDLSKGNPLRVYVRMRWKDKEKELVQVEVCPDKSLRYVTERESKGRKNKLEHIVWWEMPEQELREVLATLQFPTRDFYGYKIYTFNGDGELVRLLR